MTHTLITKKYIKAKLTMFLFTFIPFVVPLVVYCVRLIVTSSRQDILKMKWTPIFWLWISCVIFASTFAEPKREKRDLLTIKKFLISKFFGSSKRKCIAKSPARRPFKSHEIFVIPNRQKIIIEEVPKAIKPKKVSPERSNDGHFFLSSIRQFLSSEMFQETSEALWEVITGALNAEGTNTVVKDEPPQSAQHIPSDGFTVSQKLVPIVQVQERPIFEYRRPQISTYLPSMVGFVNPIISMPRIYSYEQIKGDTVEKFTLDQNSDVIVTHTRKPPRPPYVDDRIKEVILAVPPATPSFYSNIWNKQKATLSYKNEPKPDLDSANTLLRNYDNSPDQILQQYLNQFYDSTRNSDTTPLPHETNLDQYVYIPPETTQESSTKFSNIGLGSIDNSIVPTRYTYKQETNNGVIKFGNSSLKINENNVLSNDITAYTSEPIVVIPMDELSKVPYNFLTQNNKGQVRGDIPDAS